MAALQDAGALLLTQSGDFSPSAGYLAAAMDDIFGVNTYTDYVKANYYDLLAAGTYVRASDGVTYNTTTYVQAIRNGRTGDIANMALGISAWVWWEPIQ